MDVRCSDQTIRTVDDGTLADLLATARALPEGALDDAVHDCCDATASRAVNNDPDLAGEDIEVAGDLAYDQASAVGSAVNNAGVVTQVAFLLAEVGETQTRLLITQATS